MLEFLLPRSPARRGLRLAIAGVLFAVVVGLRFAVEDEGDPILIFLVLPIALVALELGLRGGLLAAAAASLAFVLWDAVAGDGLGFVDYLTRVTAFATFGGLLGLVVDRLSHVAAEVERRTLNEREALQLNNGIVQGLTLARYRLQQGDAPEAARAVDETLEHARALVSERLAEGVGVRPGQLREPGV